MATAQQANTHICHPCMQERKKIEMAGEQKGFYWEVMVGGLLSPHAKKAVFFRAKGTERVLLVHARVYRG